MKKAYFVLDTVNKESGLYYTVICPVGVESDNVIHKLTAWSGKDHEIKTSLLASTKKQAEKIYDSWRESHIQNGNYCISETF